MQVVWPRRVSWRRGRGGRRGRQREARHGRGRRRGRWRRRGQALQLAVRVRLFLRCVVVDVNAGLGSKLGRDLGRGWWRSVNQAVDGVHGWRTADRCG